VRFAGAVAALGDQGVSVFIEIGPDGTLSALGPDAAGGSEAVFIPVLRAGRPAAETVTEALARAYVRGAGVDWAAVLGGGNQVDLPTYAFQHQRYWPEFSGFMAGGAASAGPGAMSHPLLGAAVELAGEGGHLLTGRLSVRSQAWLADHTVAGTVVVPSAAFVEMAILAGDAAGCGRIEELTMEAPLVLPADGAVPIQVMVGAQSENGRRTVQVFADEGGAWARHVSGLLAPAAPPDTTVARDFATWPPEGTTPVDATGRGLNTAWRRGQDIFAEVTLPEDAVGDAALFALHPALLDATLRAGIDPGPVGESDEIGLVAEWTGVSLHATGASALRVRLRPDGGGGWSMAAADATGALVVSADSVRSRPIPLAPLTRARTGPRNSPFLVEWVPVPAEPPDMSGRWAVLGPDRLGLVPGLAGVGADVREYAGLDALADAVRAGEPVPDGVLAWAGDSGDARDTGDSSAAAARAATRRALELVQQWLAEDLLSPARLIMMTRGAVAVTRHEGVTDLAGAAVWGLAGAAQAENPDRLLLVDLPPTGAAADAVQVLAAAGGSGESELAVRGDAAYRRRLVRAAAGGPGQFNTAAGGPGQFNTAAGRQGPDPAATPSHGTVLVTGGTGMLGGLVARHLASTGRASAVILASRSGPAAPGASSLAASLAGRGTDVRVTACDTADRAALAGLLARIPDTDPLTGVVHTAGIADDGVIGSLTPARVDAVMRPKADAAWHLHELTRDTGLRQFIMFSSAAATFGGSGQANYAAANAFLDGLVSYRRAAGLPATSLAWGLWATASGISGHLSDADRARIARSGMGALTEAEGLSLFEMALTADDPVMVLMHTDDAVLSGRGDPWRLPALLRDLLYPNARRAAEAGQADTGAAALRDRLAGAAADDQRAIVLDLVLPHAAAVLGYGSAASIEADREFHELGFDSLTAIELRNRLNAATGLCLSATLVFDYPTPAILADHIRREIMRDGISVSTLALEEVGKLERMIQNVPSDDAARADLTIRVRALLSALEGTHAAAAVDDDLQAATAENIFELLDQEFDQ